MTDPSPPPHRAKEAKGNRLGKTNPSALERSVMVNNRIQGAQNIGRRPTEPTPTASGPWQAKGVR